MDLAQHQARPLNTTVLCPDISTVQLKAVITSRSRTKSAFKEFCDNTSKLTEELKLLNTLLYKNRNRFRNDKGYKTMRMVEKTVEKLLKIPLTTVLEDFLQFIPMSPQEARVQLPTLAMCRYCMLQTHLSAAVLAKIEILCRRSGHLSMQRLRLGHFWGVAAVNLAILGRVWVLGRGLLLNCHHIFIHLTKIAVRLPGEDSVYKLPENLAEFFPEGFQASSEDVNVNVDHKLPVNVSAVTVDDFLDIGEPVKRRVLEVVKEDVKRLKLEEEFEPKRDLLADIHTLEKMKDFLKTETQTRKVSKKTAYTRKLSQDEWKDVKKQVLEFMNPKLPNKSIKTCRKIIRNALK